MWVGCKLFLENASLDFQKERAQRKIALLVRDVVALSSLLVRSDIENTSASFPRHHEDLRWELTKKTQGGTVSLIGTKLSRKGGFDISLRNFNLAFTSDIANGFKI